ncbi:MAG: FeoB small GTPase domain-containing protein [Planctomycetota bacterium]
MTAPDQTLHGHGAPRDDVTETGDPARAVRTVLLVGNPNVGKSVIFNLLTGGYEVVSNYPGTTVEVARGTGKLAGRGVEVIDTPGANALGANSEEEKVARDVVIEPGLQSGPVGKTVVQVADAKNLRRALFLTAQLSELDTPTVIALNMWDEAGDRGTEIDLARLRDEVGAPVVPMVAIESRGLGALVRALDGAAVPAFRPDYGEVIEAAVSEVEGLLVGAVETGRRGIALMLLAGDNALEESLKAQTDSGFGEALARIRDKAATGLPVPLAMAIQRRRAAHADALTERTVTKTRPREGAAGFQRAAFFFAAAPALFYAVGWRLGSFILFAMSGDEPRFQLLGGLGSAVAAHAAGLASMVLYSVSALRREYSKGGSATAALARLSAHPVAGIPFLAFVLWVTYRMVGVFGAGDCVDFLETNVFGRIEEASGEYGGLVNGPLSRWLAAVVGRDGIVYALLFDGRSGLVSVGLTGALAIVLPVVTLFFLAFALMEDSGYLPRLALLADRVLKGIGLSGKAILPMVLGLGCGTLATMTTRILETRRQRLIAILLLALAVPCSAQLGIIAGVLAGISPVGVLVYVCVVLLVLVAVGWGAAAILPGERPDFLIEIPPFRRPRLGNVVVKTFHRVKWFMREAVPLFLLGSACLFVAERIGLLRFTERAARPLVSGLLGLPVGVTIAFVLSFFRRDYGAVIIFDQFRHGRMAAEQALVAMVVITLFVPCLAHLFVCVRELGWRKTLLMDAMVLALAILAGGAVRALVAVTGLKVACPT